MKLLKLTLENFKGHGLRVVEFSPTVTRVYGANGTGKTSLFDSFCWMLWAKDSDDRTQSGNVSFYPFDPDKQGEVLHNVVVKVEAVLEIDGAQHVLCRTMQEKWTTPNGTELPRFTGNETKLYIDGLAVKANQFDAFVKENINSELFKLTSNPRYFPTLHWKEQRRILMELVGDISNDDVLAADASLEPLRNELASRKPEDCKKLWQQQQKTTVKDIEKTVLLINENRKHLPQIENEADVKAELEAQRLVLMKPLEKAMQEKADILSGTAISKKQAEAKVLESKLDVIRAEQREKIAAVRKPFDEQIAALEAEAKTAAETVKPYRQTVVNLDNAIRENEEKLKVLQDSWQAVDAEEFNDVCPCCHRPYPPEQIADQRAAFNRSKAERLEKIEADGNALFDKNEENKAQRDAAMKEVQRLSKLDIEMPDKRSEIIKQREEAVQALPPMENRQDWFEASEDLKRINHEIEELHIDVKLKLMDAEKAIESAQKPVGDIDVRLAEIKAAEATRALITDYTKQQQTLREQHDELALKLSLIKKFDEIKAVMTTEKVKAILPGMDFKLFNYNNTNEGYTETCELVKDGKPYANLSNGEKIAVGCELIAAISKHYGVSNPVWIDNAEATTKHLETNGQAILLRVSAADAELRIERSN